MLREFLRSMFARWTTAMTGPLSLISVGISLFSNNSGKIGFEVLAVVCAVYTLGAMWRDERILVKQLQQRLEPKISLSFDPTRASFVARTKLTGVNPNINGAIYVRVLPKCDTQITNCRGVLSRILVLDNGIWKPTPFAEAHDLIWSNQPVVAATRVTLAPKIDQYLDVFRIVQATGLVEVTTVGFIIPINAAQVFTSGGTFRFDIVVIGDGNAEATISLKATTGKAWDNIIVEVVRDVPPA